LLSREKYWGTQGDLDSNYIVILNLMKYLLVLGANAAYWSCDSAPDAVGSFSASDFAGNWILN